MALRELLVEFTSAFDPKGLHEGHHATESLLHKVKEVGEAIAVAFAVEKIFEFVESMTDAAAAIGLQASRLNLSTDALQQWQYAGQLVGLEAGALDGVFRKLASAVVEGGKAGGESAGMFKKLGVELKGADGQFKDSGDLFEEIGLSLAGMSDQTTATAEAVKIFGRQSATRILQLFKEGKPGLEKLREEFKELGGGIDKDFIEKAEEARKSQIRLSSAWLSAKTHISAILLPAVEFVIGKLERFSIVVQHLAKETHFLEAAFVVLGAMAAASAIKILAQWGPLILRFGLWAALLVLAALAVDDLISFFEGGKSVVGDFLDAAFGPGSQEAARNWSEGTKDTFLTFFQDAKFGFGEFWAWIAETANLAAGAVADAFNAVFDFIEQGIAKANRLAAKAARFVGATDTANSLDETATQAEEDLAQRQLDPNHGTGIERAREENAAREAGRAGDRDAFKQRAKDYAARQGARSEKRAEIKAAASLDGGQSIDPGAGPLASLAPQASLAAPASTVNNTQSVNISVDAPVNVSVAPGTPAAQARATGDAAKRGAESGHRAAKAAFEQRGR